MASKEYRENIARILCRIGSACNVDEILEDIPDSGLDDIELCEAVRCAAQLREAGL